MALMAEVFGTHSMMPHKSFNGTTEYVLISIH